MLGERRHRIVSIGPPPLPKAVRPNVGLSALGQGGTGMMPAPGSTGDVESAVKGGRRVGARKPRYATDDGYGDDWSGAGQIPGRPRHDTVQSYFDSRLCFY